MVNQCNTILSFETEMFTTCIFRVLLVTKVLLAYLIFFNVTFKYTCTCKNLEVSFQKFSQVCM